MKKTGISILLVLACCMLYAQPHHFALQIDFKTPFQSARPSYVVVSNAINKYIFRKVTTPCFEIPLDAIASNPGIIRVALHTDCTAEEQQLIETTGRAKPACYAELFITGAVNAVQVRKDSIILIRPNELQLKHKQVRKALMTRIDAFNKTTGNELFQAFKAAKEEHAKDSIMRLHDNIFKVNVGRPNLDSVLMPAIQHNLSNVISLDAMNEYIRQSRVFQFDIPGETFLSMLKSMPASQQQYPLWQELVEITQTFKPRKTLVGLPAPEFVQLRDSSGKTVHLKDLKGKVVFIDFWASWCGPCMAQVPKLKAIYDKLNHEAVAFVGISLDENSGNWRQAIHRSSLNWINVSDLKGLAGITTVAYNVVMIPHNFLINSKGIIVQENISPDDLAAAIEKAMN